MFIKGFVKSEDYVDYQLWLNSNPIIPAGVTTVEAYYKFHKGQSNLGDFI